MLTLNALNYVCIHQESKTTANFDHASSKILSVFKKVVNRIFVRVAKRKPLSNFNNHMLIGFCETSATGMLYLTQLTEVTEKNDAHYFEPVN